MDDERQGVLGCGCALLPGLVLGVFLYVAAGVLLASHNAALPKGEGNISISLSEDYLAQMARESIRNDLVDDWFVDVRPDKTLRLEGRVSTGLLGRSISLPIVMVLEVAAEAGTLHLTLREAQIPGAEDPASTEATMLPFLDQLNASLQNEIRRLFGSEWKLVDVMATDESLTLQLVR